MEISRPVVEFPPPVCKKLPVDKYSVPETDNSPDPLRLYVPPLPEIEILEMLLVPPDCVKVLA